MASMFDQLVEDHNAYITQRMLNLAEKMMHLSPLPIRVYKGFWNLVLEWLRIREKTYHICQQETSRVVKIVKYPRLKLPEFY